MKNLKSILIITIINILMFSCSNENTSVDTDIDSLSQIKNLTGYFLSHQKEIDQIKAMDPDIWLADCVAGLDSYLEDGDIKKAYQVGYEASIKYSEGGITNPNPGNPIDNVINLGNELDYVGEYHAEMLYLSLTNNYDFIYPNGIFNYQNTTVFMQQYLTSKNIIASPMPSENEFNLFYTNIEDLITDGDHKFSKIVLVLENQGKLPSLETQILRMYFQGQENSESLNNFIAFSIEMENIIQQSSYPNSTKELLLFTMATVRHDVNFWNPY